MAFQLHLADLFRLIWLAQLQGHRLFVVSILQVNHKTIYVVTLLYHF